MKFLVNPNRFSKIADSIFKPLILLSITFLLVGLIFSFFLSPNDYQQGSTVRIMYIHVPSAWLSLMTFLIMTFYSIVGLAFKMPFGFIINGLEDENYGESVDEFGTRWTPVVRDYTTDW